MSFCCGFGLPFANNDPPLPGLLDVYPGAVFAFSTRLLRDGYAGPCLRVRRSSDNAEADIGFSTMRVGGYRWIDQAAIESFVGPGDDGFVTRWYNQAGTSVYSDAVQATASNQPWIVGGGSLLVTATGKARPALRGDLTRETQTGRRLVTTPVSGAPLPQPWQSHTVFSVFGTGTQVPAQGTAGTAVAGIYHATTSGGSIAIFAGSARIIIAGLANGHLYSGSATIDGASSFARAVSTQQLSGSIGPVDTGAQTLGSVSGDLSFLANLASGSSLRGDLGEIVVWPGTTSFNINDTSIDGVWI